MGLALSLWLIRLLIAISPPNTPRIDEIGIDLRVFGVHSRRDSARRSVVWTVSGTANFAAQSQRNAERQRAAWIETADANRVGSLLIVSEIALSFILLAGAGLLIKSFLHLREIDPGFNADNVLAMRLSLPPGKYQQGEPRAQIYKQLVDKVKATPGVQSAAAVLSLPLGGDTFNVGRGVIP